MQEGRNSSGVGLMSQGKKTPPRIMIEGSSDSNPGMVQPSPTVNTKEALNLVRQMWGKEEETKGEQTFLSLQH